MNKLLLSLLKRLDSLLFRHMARTGLLLAVADPNAPAIAPAGDNTAEPEQKPADVAQPQNDEPNARDQSQASEDEDKGLTEEQKTIRKLQRRIDRLTAKKGGSDREAQLARDEAAQLRQRLERLEAGQGGEDDEEPTPRKQRQLTEADVDRLANERARDLLYRHSLDERVRKVVESGKNFEGFVAASNAVNDEVPFVDRRGRPTPFIEAVLDCENPAAVLYHLGTNPDEAADLADLTPAQLGRRLAKLEDRLKEGAKKQTSAAPKPLKPVDSKASTQADETKMSDAEWREQRRKQRA